MNFHYQIIFFGDNIKLFDEIQSEFLNTIDVFKIPRSVFVFLINDDKGYKGNQPAFCVCSNSKKEYDNHISGLIERQIAEGNPILPLYEKDFDNEVKGKLRDFNARVLSDGIKAIVNDILQSFNLLRRKRKLFISYRRNDSREIAVQLFEYFESKNYDVFLDTHSVPKSSVFQKELWHQLSDSDIVILLDTEDFLNSYWCEEELSFAQNKRITILRLKFPSSSIEDDDVALTYTYSLPECYKTGEKGLLDSKIMDEISLLVEGLRARALAARQDNVITEFINTGLRYGITAIRKDFGLITCPDNSSNTIHLMPAIGVPVSKDYHNIEEHIKDNKIEANRVYLIYDDSSVLQGWINHLNWLDSQLEIKTLKTSDYDNFFKKLI